MSIAASFPSVKKPRYVDLGEERQTTEHSSYIHHAKGLLLGEEEE
jgi:hypothetical protein